MKLNRSKFVYGLLVIAATYSLTARAETDYNGQYARNIGVTYQVGENNSVVGQITNNTNHTVYVAAEFKGYAADGQVSQGGATAIFDHLDPGETARFKSGGFFEAIKSAKLTTLRTVP
ncbi:FxLYD domain-containing protein [Paraburkholderia nemoris]|uniref:FxLYD domain-containing protein n=1 Tax=Paraburkholderia nemoris TaxID=2793076 RepID=UPI0038B7D242